MIIEQANRLNQTTAYYFATKFREIAKMNKEGRTVINLGIGSPDLPPHDRVLQVLNQAASSPNNHGYQSYSGLPALREAFANYYERDYLVSLDAHREVLPLIGSKEGIMHVSMAFLNAGDTVLVPNPGYPTYSAVSKLVQANIVHYELRESNAWMPDLDRLEVDLLERAKVIWINYPNMPTGVFPDEEKLSQLIQLAKKHKFLIINDNPYSKVLHEKAFSIFQLPGAKEVCLELTSLSKSFNMAGWRIGALMGKEAYINTVMKVKSNMDSGMFKPLQLAAVEALSLSKAWFDNLNKIYAERKLAVYKILDHLKVNYDTNQGGLFVWAKIPTGQKDSKVFCDEILQKAHVFITPGSIFGTAGDQYLRVSLCSSLEVYEEALNRIQKKLSI